MKLPANMSLDTDPQQQEAAPSLVLWSGQLGRYTSSFKSCAQFPTL